MSSIRQSLVYSKLASLRILQFRAWKGDQGMADGRWAVDGPKEVGYCRRLIRLRNAGRINRQESMDRCTPLVLGFDRERAVQDFQPLMHAD
jgi:hypothetical protein